MWNPTSSSTFKAILDHLNYVENETAVHILWFIIRSIFRTIGEFISSQWQRER
jgi:hypothetical protein